MTFVAWRYHIHSHCSRNDTSRSFRRPLDSPYARAKLDEKRQGVAGRKGLDGQKEMGLSELDLLVGDVLYFNNRVTDTAFGLKRGVVGAGASTSTCAESVAEGYWCTAVHRISLSSRFFLRVVVLFVDEGAGSRQDAVDATNAANGRFSRGGEDASGRCRMGQQVWNAVCPRFAVVI